MTPARSQLAPLPVFLGTLGMPGLTAYFGLLDIGQPKPGETVVVSGAAGAVGSVVGQIAKIQGCRAVGIAGGAEKCALPRASSGSTPRSTTRPATSRRRSASTVPKGIDVYFDNVGGDILDAALAQLALRARVVICGAISQYNDDRPVAGPANYLSLLVNRASMTGMVVIDYAPRFPEAIVEMAGWMAAGKLTLARGHRARARDVPGGAATSCSPARTTAS